MALKPMTLQERVKQAQALTQQSTDKRAASQGLVAPPITAVGVGALQGTPQQQAMAGTPAQKKGAISAAVQGQVAAPKEETGLELAQQRRELLPADEAKSQRMQRYSQALGTFGDKVNEWIESAIQTSIAPVGADGKVPTGAVIPTLELNEAQQKIVDKAIEALDAKKDAKGKQAVTDAMKTLTTINPNRTDAEVNAAILTLNNTLGNTTTAALFTGTVLEGYWKNVEESIGSQLQTGVQTAIAGKDRNLTIEDIKELGTTTAELAELLDLPEAEVLNLTIDGLQSRLVQIQQQAFGETQAVTANISSALTSETEREALRVVGQQLEEAGIAGAEQQYQQLLDDIDQGTRIDLAGKTYTIDELLNTDVFVDLTRSYYLGTDTELIKELKKSSPDLVAFWDRNKDALLAVIEAGKVGADRLVAHNKNADEVRSTIDWDTLQKLGVTDSRFKPGSILPVDTKVESLYNEPQRDAAGNPIPNTTLVPPVVSAIMAMPPGEDRTKAANTLSTTVAGIPPGEDFNAARESIKKATPQQLLDENTVNRFNNEMLDFIAVKSPGSTEQQLLNTLFEPDVPLNDINTQLAKDKLADSIGGPVSSYWQYDTDKSGSLSREEIQALTNNIKAPVFGQPGNTGANTLKMAEPTQLSPEQTTMTQIAADGQFDDAEFDSLSLDDMANIFNAFKRPEDAQAASSPMLAAIRRNYLKKLDAAKVGSYQKLGLQPDGAPVIETGGILFGNRLQYLEYGISFYESALNGIKKLMDETANPDLKWRYEEDYNRMVKVRDEVKTEMNQLSGKAQTTREGGFASTIKEKVGPWVQWSPLVPLTPIPKRWNATAEAIKKANINPVGTLAKELTKEDVAKVVQASPAQVQAAADELARQEKEKREAADKYKKEKEQAATKYLKSRGIG